MERLIQKPLKGFEDYDRNIFLSPNQFKILNFVRKALEEKDQSPTIREICESLPRTKSNKVVSTSVVDYNLDRLVKANLLARSENPQRNLYIPEGVDFDFIWLKEEESSKE